MLWDITTKFLPVEDLIKSQLFTNFDGYSLKNGAATPLTIWNFSRAWQAYFLSNNLQIWRENTSFNDLQMIWNNVFDTSIGFWFEKIWLSCTVHSYSLYLSKQKMVSSKLTVALFLAAKYQMAVKNRIAMSFELTISCLQDRRFNQLSHRPESFAESRGSHRPGAQGPS